ncbi:hypothetical protein GCM10027341_15270 [Spirosoma knui]
MTIEARGAEGGNNPSSAFRPGKGAIITATVPVTPGQSLSILVGGRPTSNLSSGGGGTFVVTTNNQPLVIAGGGGGSGSVNDSQQKQGQAGRNGGAGADADGSGGTGGNGGRTPSIYGAGGGLLTDGEGLSNRGGRAFINGGIGGYQGGGFGGGGTGSGTTVGGGGGGYSGGGGAGFSSGVGGGGGSYFEDPAGTTRTGPDDGNSGNGQVIISYAPPCSAFTAQLNSSGPLTCATTSVQLSATSGLEGASYKFIGQGLSGEPTSSSAISVTASGSYSVTVTNPGGCSATATTAVLSNLATPQNVTLSSSGTLTCAQTSVSLTAGSTTQGVAYNVVGPEGFSASGPTISVNRPGTYTLTVTGANGCTAIQTTTVESNTLAPTISDLSNQGPLTCLNTDATVSAIGTGFDSFSVSGPSGTRDFVQTATGLTFKATQSGVYSVTLTNTANGCAAVASTTVGNNTTPPQNLTLVQDGSITCIKTTVLLTATSSTTGLLSYNFEGPYAITQTGTASATVSGPGTYTVTVTGPNGCTASATTTVVSNTLAPDAELVSPGTVTCANPVVTLLATPANQSSYVFSGPGLDQNGTSATASVTAGGLYSVTVTGANGCSAVATTTVESNTSAPENVSLTNNGPLTCAQTSVTLSATSSSSGLLSYTFAGPGLISQDGGSMAMATEDGLYSVIITGANGCTASATTTVESNTLSPQATLINSGTLTCANPTVTLTATPSGQSNYVFTGPGFSQSDTNPMVMVSEGGTYSVIVTGSNGCTATATTTVSSNTAAPANLSLMASNTLSCSQPTATLTASATTDTPPLTYRFAGPSGPLSATANLTTVSSEGTYSVTATAANGCSASATTNVSGNNVAPGVNLSNSGPLSFTNTNVTLTATTNPGGLYNYSFSQGATQQGSSNTATVTTAGVYSVTVTRQDNGCSSTASTTVLGGNNPTVCRGGTAVISVAVEGDPVKYEWYKNSLTTPKIMETPQLFRGTATSSLTLINAQTNTQGNFFLKVTDRSGTVRVYGPYRLTVDASCRAREVAQLETPLQVELAPNPIQRDRLRAVVRGAEGRSLQVELIDLSGKPIRQQRWQQAESQQVIDWDLQAQSSGLYLLQVISEAGASVPAQRQSLKVVKP